MSLLPLAIANGWAAGINAYAVVLLMGLAGRYDLFADSPDVLQRTDVLIAAGVLTVADVIADKIPYVDSLWDGLHTVIRPSIAAVLGVLLSGDASTLGQAVMAVGMGSTALASHLSKAGIRLAVNTSPEPLSTIGVSTVEDLSVAGVVLLAFQHPWIAAAVAIALLVAGGALAVYLITRIRRAWRSLASRFRAGWAAAPQPPPPAPPPRDLPPGPAGS